MAHTNTARLSRAGVSIWLDDLSRDRLDSGSLAALIQTHDVVGVTTNPTIFAQAIGSGEAYRARIDSCAAKGLSTEDVIFELTCQDVADACDLLLPVFQRSSGRDGWVSIEVDPNLAHDTEATVAAAHALHTRIQRPNVMIKVPATPAGVYATTELISAGISVNVTLVFALTRYREVLNAYTVGIERARANGLDISAIHSVASVFVSRVDSEIDARLEAIGTEEARQRIGHAAVANALLCYEVCAQNEVSARSQLLRSVGANTQRVLWASTGVKRAEVSPTHYVAALALPGTVNTMPAATLEAVAHDIALEEPAELTRYREADATLNSLAELGIEYLEVMAELEQRGLDQFVNSWEALHTVVKEAVQ